MQWQWQLHGGLAIPALEYICILNRNGKKKKLCKFDIHACKIGN